MSPQGRLAPVASYMSSRSMRLTSWAGVVRPVSMVKLPEEIAEDQRTLFVPKVIPALFGE